MKQFELNGKTIAFVEVPIEAINSFAVINDFVKDNIFNTLYMREIDKYIELDGLGWDFLTLSKDMTEEVAQRLVKSEPYHGWYWSYESNKYNFSSALESFRSFEIAFGIDYTRNYAILIKE